MASQASAFSPENANFFRLTKLLLDVGTDILREVFQTYYASKTLDQYLSDGTTKNKIQKLSPKPGKQQKSILSQQQYDLLYPAAPGKADVNNFDITLLSCLLRNLHNTKLASDVVWSNPPSADTSIEADVCRIRETRNKLFAHASSPELSHAEFRKKEQEIETVMIRMAGQISSQSFLKDTQDKIDNILTGEIEPHVTKLKQELEKCRALQETVDKVKQKVDKIKGKMEEVEQKVDKVQDDVTGVKQEVEDMHGDVSDVKSKMDKVDEKVDKVDVKVDKVDEKVDKVDEEVDKVDVKVHKVDEKVDKVDEKVNKVDEKLDEKVDNVDEKVDKVDEKVDKVDQKVDKVDEKMDKVDEKVDKVDEKMNKVDQKVDIVDEKMNKVDEKMDIVDEKVDKVDKKMNKVDEKVDIVDEKMNKVDEMVDIVDEKVDKVDEKVDKVDEKVDIVDEKVDKVDEKVDKVDEKVDKVDEKMDKVDEKVDKVDEKVNKVHDDVKDLRSKVGNIQGSKDTDLERLRSSLLSAYKCYTSISASPLAEEGDIPLDDLFTDVAIIEDYQERDMEKKDVGMPDEEKKTKTREEIRVKSYKDIFDNKEKEENVKSIVVLGEAGSGKTVYSKQMVNKWRKAHLKLLSGEKITNDDEEMMARYDFLFYIPLRYIKRTGTLLDAVFQSVGDDKMNRRTTKYIFEECPEKVLVICDGLDEVDWYPSRHNFHIFTIVTTTRPWKYDSIKEGEGRSPRKDRVLKLTGLGENGVTELAQHLRRTSYKNRPEASVDNFLEEVEEIGLMESLNESPLILVYLLHVWFQSGKLSTSLTANLLGIIECILKRGEKKLKSRGDNLLKDTFSHSLKLEGISLGPACDQYGKLLMMAAKIAFKSLINTTRENTLVFSDAMLHNLIENPVHLEASLQLGLISESEQVHVLHTDHNFSFPHKLFQEFFMALHLVINQTSLTEFYNYCNTLDKVLEMSNVFIFTAVLCNKTALQLSKHVVDICDRDEKVVKFRSDISAKTKDLIRDMTKMYIKCTEEHMKLKPDRKCELCMSDMYIYCGYRSIPNWGVLTTLLQTSACTLKSLYFESYYVEDSLHNINNTLKHLTKAKHLIRLHLELRKCDKDTNTYVNKIIANNSKLCVLHIDSALSLHRLSLRFPGWWRPPLPHLQHLYIENVTTTRYFSRRLSALLRLGHLRSLHLSTIDIGNFCLDMSQLTDLYRLSLEYVVMSGSLWWRVLNALNNLPALKELELNNFPTPDDSDVPAPPADLHLTFINRLHKVRLVGNRASSPMLHHILCSVGDDSQVRRLVVKWRDIPATSVPPLLSTITHSHHLEELVLWYINTGSHHVSLHNHTNLKTLTLYNVTSDHVSLHNNTNLKTLTLHNVTMSPEAWGQLFASIQMLPHLTTLYIDMDYLNHPALDPGAASWYRLFRSLQSLPHMAELTLDDVNIPGDVRLPNNMIIHKYLHDNGNIKWLLVRGERRSTE